MSVKVTSFDDPTAWPYVHDDAPGGSHGGTLDPATVTWGVNMDGSGNHTSMVVPCPFEGCGSVSTWPVGGGADAVLGQQLFVTKTEAEGCPCGQIEAGRSDGVPESHVRLNCNRMDGPGRWQLDDTPQVVTQEGPEQQAKPVQFQTVYQETDGLIVGLEPAGGVGNDLKVAVFHDQEQYDNLMRYDPAYVSLPDKDHIVGTPQSSGVTT